MPGAGSSPPDVGLILFGARGPAALGPRRAMTANIPRRSQAAPLCQPAQPKCPGRPSTDTTTIKRSSDLEAAGAEIAPVGPSAQPDSGRSSPNPGAGFTIRPSKAYRHARGLRPGNNGRGRSSAPGARSRTHLGQPGPSRPSRGSISAIRDRPRIRPRPHFRPRPRFRADRPHRTNALRRLLPASPSS